MKGSKTACNKLGNTDRLLYELGLVALGMGFAAVLLYFCTGINVLRIKYPCIFNQVTHLCCPGCGGTRALRALLNGEIIKSLYDYPPLLYGVIVYIVFMVRCFLYKHFGKGIDKFFNSSITSRREILTDALKEQGVSVINSDGSAKKMKQLLKDFEKITNPIAKKNLKLKTWAQLAGYLYSGIVLGAGVPYLNISVTNKVTAKRNAKKNHEKAVDTAKNHFFDSQISNTSFAGIKNNYDKNA